MAIVNKDIGTGGRDYSTITLWEADDGGGDGLGNDDCTGTCYNDSVFDETVAINFSANTISLTVASGERHNGIAGTGARIVRTASATNLFDIASTGADIRWLELDANGQSIRDIFSDGITNTNVASRMIVHGNARSGTSRGMNTRGVFVNCIVYDVHNTGGGGGAIGIDHTRNNLENCTVHNVKCDDASNSEATCIRATDGSLENMRNCIATDPGGSTTSKQCFSPSSFSNATVSHCLSSDTTASGTGSLTSKASVDQFVSTTEGSEDLHLKSGADAIDVGTDLGTTPTDVEFDINDRDRDTEGDVWDMGAHEFVATISGQIIRNRFIQSHEPPIQALVWCLVVLFSHGLVNVRGLVIMAGVFFTITTESEVALVAATEKTVLQIRAATNHRVLLKEWSVSFDGVSNTAQPVEVELRRTSADGTLTAATEQKVNEGDNETIQATGHINATAEPTTKTETVKAVNVHPQIGYTWQAPYGGEIVVIGGNAIALIMTAPAAVNCWVDMTLEE